MRSGRKIATTLIGFALAVLLGAGTFLHTALDSSSPAAGERLAAPPSEVRLTFTTPVDPRLARVGLLTADSVAVALDSLRAGESSAVVVAPVAGSMSGGEFTVTWQVIGSDGHPVRGRFAFVLDAPAAAAEPAAVADPEVGPPPPVEEEPVVGVASPAYVATRWLTLTTILVLIGAVVFRTLVLPTVRRRSNLPSGGALDEAAARAAGLGRGAAVFLLLAIPLRVALQARAMDAGDDTARLMHLMLIDTPWGWGVLLQAGAGLLALVAFARAARDPRNGWAAAAVAALLLAVTPALSGHAAAVEPSAGAAIAADSVHVLAVSAWLGTLLVLLVAGVPAAFRTGGGAGTVADMVSVFSPLALGFAAVAAGTGVFAAVLHLGAVSDLWATAWGRTLLVKLGVVALVAAAGAFNWRRVRPRLADTGPGPLRRSAGAELLGAAVVLLITALLIATPTP